MTPQPVKIGRVNGHSASQGRTPAIIETHHVPGEDCFVLKVLARSMRHLEEVTGRIAVLGTVTANVVYSGPLAARAVET